MATPLSGPLASRRLGTQSGDLRRMARQTRDPKSRTAITIAASQARMGEGSAITSASANLEERNLALRQNAGLMELRRRQQFGTTTPIAGAGDATAPKTPSLLDRKGVTSSGPSMNAADAQKSRMEFYAKRNGTTPALADARPAAAGGSTPTRRAPYSVVDPDADNATYFKSNPRVTGMAWGAGLNGSDPKSPRTVMLNPNSGLTKEQQAGVVQNERLRHFMAESDTDPDFEPTPEQIKSFEGEEYGKPENRKYLKQTLVSRILTGDDSAGNVTPQQRAAAEAISQKYNSTFASEPAPQREGRIDGMPASLATAQVQARMAAGGPREQFGRSLAERNLGPEVTNDSFRTALADYNRRAAADDPIARAGRGDAYVAATAKPGEVPDPSAVGPLQAALLRSREDRKKRELKERPMTIGGTRVHQYETPYSLK